MIEEKTNDKMYTYMMVVITCLIVILLSGYIADNVRKSSELINDHNIEQLERCTYLQCTYTLTGNLRCNTLDVHNMTTPIVHKNLTVWKYYDY